MKPKRAATSRGGDEMREIEVAKVWQVREAIKRGRAQTCARPRISACLLWMLGGSGPEDRD
jgi:hypothetical protein